MVFSSLVFICVFLPVVFLLNLAIRPIGARNILLIIVSLVFYAYGEPAYILLMLFSSMMNWAFGLAAGQVSRTGAKASVALAVVCNLALLGIFKYAAMAAGVVNDLLGGMVSVSVPDVALPIGISFYTFQALSYVIDVYRGDAPAQRNYLHVLLYIAFFPQLIAGPIIKYHDIEEQIIHRTICVEGIARGLRRFCFGLAKKVLIANVLASAVDAIFAADMASINIMAAWLAAIAYVLQIYFDFSGYSDMAIGMASMFGFSYKENFNYPYCSTSVKEFWRRWHISLSTWYKEYLYIPLGGNRRGRPRTVLNKLIVFILCGLWHGAAWTFVVWGLIHGLFLLFEEFVPIRNLPRPLGWLYTMFVVTFAFVLFRADSFDQGLYFMQQMVSGFSLSQESMSLVLMQLTPQFIVTIIVAIVAAQPIKPFVEQRLLQGDHVGIWEAIAYAAGIILLALCMLSLSAGGYNPFIYFRF